MPAAATVVGAPAAPPVAASPAAAATTAPAAAAGGGTLTPLWSATFPHTNPFASVSNIQWQYQATVFSSLLDVWSRLIVGGRVSMSVGVVAVNIAMFIGTLIGLLSGAFGGAVDNLLMRFTELIQTFPLFFAVVIFVALVGPNIVNVMLVIGLLSWPGGR